MAMFAPTASQMLRDDERLRTLHRETKKRRKRFLAKQKRLENEEINRRMNALDKRKKQRNKHLYAVRKNKNRNRNNYYGNNKPIRVQPTKIENIPKNNDELSAYIVPVCHQLPSQSPATNNKSKIRKKKGKKKLINDNNINKIVCEQKAEIELYETKNDKEEFEMEMSDETSITELDNFERKHFGIQQSIQCTKQSKQTDTYHTRKCLINDCNAKKAGGYHQIFKKTTQYKEEEQGMSEYGPSPSQSQSQSRSISLFNMNDIDMKTPEDNDSVKINPKDSIDCSKTSFSTIYNANLLPLQSVSSLDCPSKRKPKRYQYGIKLPRLTESILKEKDSIDSHQSFCDRKSTFSAPIFNNNHHNIAYNIAFHRKRQTTTIIDDFFTNTCDESVDNSVQPHRNSNNSMFLPNINRHKLKAKFKRKPAYSVCEYDLLKEEKKLEQSLLKINETLSKLSVNKINNKKRIQLNYKNKYPVNTIKKRACKYANYLNETKVPSIPRKIKVKRSPTFKSNRRRRRWNI